jgi:hypothetical protein
MQAPAGESLYGAAVNYIGRCVRGGCECMLQQSNVERRRGRGDKYVLPRSLKEPAGRSWWSGTGQ